MPRRPVRPVDEAGLAKLTTARLVAYRKRLLELEESLALSDLDGPDELARLDPDRLHFKDDPRWQRLHAAVKAELLRRTDAPRS